MEPLETSPHRSSVPAEAPAASGHARWLALVDRSPVIFYRAQLQPEIRLEYLSPAAEQLSGYRAEQLIAEPALVWQLIHPDDRSALERLFGGAWPPAAAAAFRIVRRDGVVLHLEHTAVVTRNDRETPVRIEGTLRDVTVLRVPGHELSPVPGTEEIPAALYVADADGVATFSPAIETLTGFAPEDWLRQPGLWAERLHPDDRSRVLFLATAAAGQPWHADYRWIARDGRIIELRQASAPMRGEHGEPIGSQGLILAGSAGESRDRGALVAQRMDAMARLGGIVAHDFNNLLMVMLGHAEMLLDTFTEPGLPHDSALEIRHAAEAAARMTNQLLALSGRQSFVLSVVDLNDVIRDVADTLHELAGGEVDVRFDLGSNLLPVEVDVRQCERVLRHLVLDARNAMPGGGRITVRTRVDHPGGRAEVRLTVSDNRPAAQDDAGVSPFEPTISTRRSPRGAGLHRAAVYGIVGQFGGWIAADSQPAGGHAFTIGLPAKAR